ncbi:hypothetical protein AOL_s00007g419 [Orbilia oligospora ATCC 24927]|uniref:UDP-N-acetylmuramyl-tripeptide synthetase n=1 Tax=Arthrobotrys oligospora (strain ATCC 24927 / CBS 115.81 / DSM 1491) TaxID=756982 RepID=G1X2B0_ARTOA|nr:hypothetical protein AOL_s00007g419 [Orbilia oligospora ATCC 24927]EGX52636.1 hypothetical protein AOL_s00007g419 [Orbilia oligospora ATCC 24927]
MHSLEQLLSPVSEAEIISGNKGIQITQIFDDSREVIVGSAFISIPLDGDIYEGFSDEKETRMVAIALDAIKRGAVAIIAENKGVLLKIPDSVTKVFVPDARRASGLMAAEFYDHPSRKMVLIGATGTNGKTTTANLTASILRHAGFKSVGVIGTLGATTENMLIDIKESTTPRSLVLQGILSRFLEAGVEAVVMEVSSHGLALQRVVECAFDAAIFTNLTEDHLDFHKTMEGYWAAKMLLFSDIAKYSMQFKRFAAIINTDDEYGRNLIKDVVEASYEYITYSVTENSDIKAEDIKISNRKIGFTINKYCEDDSSVPFTAPLVGRFNVYNCLAAISVGQHLKIPPSSLQDGLNCAKAPTGRMEFIDEGQSFNVIVDYAYNPDGLEKVLTALKELVTGRLICVFGASDHRYSDRLKRSSMGSVAVGLADLVILTSDNPGFEDPQGIVEDILVGVRNMRKESITRVEIDRREAIKLALEMAEEGDTVLFAGKAQEEYQILGEEKTAFDERGIVRDTLRSLLKVERTV